MSLRGKVQAGEGVAAWFSTLAFFLILTSYFIIRPVRDQLSGAVGSTALPLFYSATFVATLALTPVFGALVSRVSRRALIAVSYSFFIVCLVVFVPAFMAQARIGPRLLGVVFFIWVSVFNLFVVSLFWSLMADLFDSRQSHRLFPLIGIGGTAGAVAGPMLTTFLVGSVGVAPLLVISALLLAAAMVVLLWLSWRDKVGAAPAPPIGGTIWAGIRLAIAQPFVRLMAILMLLSDGVGTGAYALLADYSKAHFVDSVTRTAFYSRIDWATNVLVILLQMFFTRWILVRRGPGVALVIAEVANVLLFVALAVFALHTLPIPWFDWASHSFTLVAVPMIALVVVGTRCLAYGVIVPASNTLYTQVARETRYKAKNFVDTVVWRSGDVLITSSVNGLRALGAGVGVIALLGATAAATAGWVGWRASRSPDLNRDERRVTAPATATSQQPE